MSYKAIQTTLYLVILSAMAAMAQVTLPPIDSILKVVESNNEITTDIKAGVTMTQQKTGQGTKVIEMQYYRRDKDESFLIEMTGPESERGNGYLRVAENFWMYRRNTRTFQHVNRDESIGGTDARGDDFENRKITELFRGKSDANGTPLLRSEMLGKIPTYRLEMIAKVNDVDYPHKILWVRQDNMLVLKEESYTQNGTLMQTAYYHKYTLINNKPVPIRQMFIDEFEKGNRTVVELSALETKPLDPKIFTKAFLESRSK